MNTPSITFRKATLTDVDAIFALLMQEHINPFMTFEIMSKDAFLTVFQTMCLTSDVFVIEENDKIVATKRIIPKQGDHAHTVELASFGVDKNHLRKGYGKLMYEFLTDEIKQSRKHISRIEIIQETDNPIALALAEKMGYQTEVVFPDWIKRETGLETYQKKWRVGARFMANIINPQPSITTEPFQPQLPDLKAESSDISLEFAENKMEAFCYYHQQLVATCYMSSIGLRLAHLQFWDIKLENDAPMLPVANFLRHLAILSAATYKKVELFIADEKVITILRNLGFHCRGVKTASRKMGLIFHDELGVDLGFYNCEDAKSIVLTHDRSKHANILNLIDACKNIILQMLQTKMIDRYAALYLENLVFQMIRETHSETSLYKDYSPWQHLIAALPSELQVAFANLYQF